MARSYLPPGFRFHPTDEELLMHYLKKKVAGRRLHDGVIGEVEIYKFEPADLPGLAILQSRDPEWFFFNAQDKKYLHGARTNRTTKAGYWKATGKDRKISAGSCTGMKKTLIYYSGRAPHGTRTDWVMHEYRLDEEFENKMNCSKSFVLCRIRRKGGLGPRNGEQYGAPVLEISEENQDGPSTSFPLEEAFVFPSADSKFGDGHILEKLHVVSDEGVARTERVGVGDEIDSFLQALISYEEQEQQPVEDEVLTVDDLLCLVEDINDFAPTISMDNGFVDMDKFCDLLHPVDSESVILEDLLHFASGGVGIPNGLNGGRGLQEPSNGQLLNNMDNDGFIELADLEEPCHQQGTSESFDIENLLYELDNGVESTRLAQERGQAQSLQSFGNRQSLRGLQHHEASGLVNEPLALEVPLDSSQGLIVLESVYTRLITSDDGGGLSDDLPSGSGSGSVLNPYQEGVFTSYSTSSVAHSHSHSSRAEEQSEAQLLRVENLPGVVHLDLQGGGHLVASVSNEETEVAHEGYVPIDSNTREQALEQLDSTAVLPNSNTKHYSSVGSLAPSPSTPSSFARVISGLLGKVNALPASADEMPVELDKCKPFLKDSSKYSTVEQSVIRQRNSSSSSGASLHFRVKLTDLEHNARTPEMELQLSVSQTGSEQVSAKPCKSFTNALSLFLFRMTTLAVILFCMFRGVCKSTRSAFL